MNTYPRTFIFNLLLAAALTTPGWAQSGAVISGPENIREFAPEEKAVTVDASTANVKRILEDLGSDAAEWYQHVQTLSNPFFEGRAPGSRGMALAEEYAEFWFRRAGLDPAFPSSGSGSGDWTEYRQQFALPGEVLTVSEASCTIGGRDLVAGTDFSVLGISDSGEVEAPLAFVGYGIESGPDGYSSFVPMEDLSNTIAILLRYEPLDEEGNSLWSDQRFSARSSIVAKMLAVSDRKPKAIIMVNPPGSKRGRTGLETVDGSRFGRRMNVPVIQLTEDAADRLLKEADPKGRGLMEWRRLADKGEVKTQQLDTKVKVSIKATVTEGTIPAANIGGVLRGKGRLAEEWLIIGAHLDHVGYGYFGTSNTNRGQLHPGADDNASGSAGLLLLARQLAAAYAAHDGSGDGLRSVLFLAFTAEESGLRGSKHYVQNPTLTTDRVTAMINMDMIGRLRSDTLSVGGVGSAEGFEEFLRPLFQASGLTVATEPGGRGPSDHSSFYGVGVPVLFAFTGMHEEYHTPKDSGWTVNPGGAIKVINLIRSISLELASRSERLIFKSTDTGPGQDRGYATVRLGIQPGFGEELETGIVVDGVSDGTSAADAGIQSGDVLLTWNGEELKGMASLMQNLQHHKPGDVVKITLRRDGAEMVVDVTLKASRGGPRRPETNN